MATKVFMEALSPTMEEGRLVKWIKNEGDVVKSGEPIGEVETDKAIMELVARGDGVLRKRLINEGDAVPVGTLVGVIAGKDENIDALVSAAGAPAAAAAAPAAPTPTANAQQSTGPSQAAPAQPPQRAAEPVPPARPAPPAAAQPPAAGSNAGNGEHVRSSPLARRIAGERGVNLGSVQGSGPGGRIIKRDIEAAAAAGAPAAAGAGSRAPAPTPSRPTFEGDYQDVPLTQIRKIIAKRLGESIGPIPTFYLTAELDLTRVMEMRAAMAGLGGEYKVSVNDVLLKAIAVALSQHPEVNAHWLGDHIRYFNRVHLGMAVATDDGLIVPVIWDADGKGLSTISREAKELATRARERKLKPEEFTGSTFSVSNLGMFGIDQFTAIINPPEAGIIAIGTAEDKLVAGTPGAGDGEPVVRKRVRLTMSCDHRVIDGAVGAKFLQALRRLVENPLMLVY
jgi:pyruvate dehydrogenase E2 component (dihydrolipoamide acetyltransferase)